MRKLKPDRSIVGAIPVMVTLTLFFVTLALFGFRSGFYVLAICFGVLAALNVLMYARLRSTGDLVSAIYFIFAMLVCLTEPDAIIDRDLPPFLASFSGMVVSGIAMAHLLFNRRLKWRGRELLELAALPVENASNGFTARPRPAGRVEATQREILGFAEFVGRNLIALPIVEDHRVVMRVVKMGSELDPSVWLKPDYAGKTWVSLGFDGDVAVNLSQEDYLDFREDLSFDQLCASLAGLLVEFLDLFRRGQGVRVIDRLDSLQMGILS